MFPGLYAFASALLWFRRVGQSPVPGTSELVFLPRVLCKCSLLLGGLRLSQAEPAGPSSVPSQDGDLHLPRWQKPGAPKFTCPGPAWARGGGKDTGPEAGQRAPQKTDDSPGCRPSPFLEARSGWHSRSHGRHHCARRGPGRAAGICTFYSAGHTVVLQSCSRRSGVPWLGCLDTAQGHTPGEGHDG